MPYRIRDLDDLQAMGRSAGDDFTARLETALNIIEDDGWTLVHVMDQRQLWDDQGVPEGKAEVTFVFHQQPSRKPFEGLR